MYGISNIGVDLDSTIPVRTVHTYTFVNVKLVLPCLHVHYDYISEPSESPAQKKNLLRMYIL